MARKDSISPEDVARKLGISVKTVYKWSKQGRLPTMRYGYTLRFDPDAIERYRDACDSEMANLG